VRSDRFDVAVTGKSATIVTRPYSGAERMACAVEQMRNEGGVKTFSREGIPWTGAPASKAVPSCSQGVDARFHQKT
jgi:hypothetical protein